MKDLIDKLANPQFYAENRIAAHSDHVPYSSYDAMESGENDFRLILNGLWKFHYVKNFDGVIKGFEVQRIHSSMTCFLR